MFQKFWIILVICWCFNVWNWTDPSYFLLAWELVGFDGVIYANGDANVSAAAFVSGSEILSYPVEQSFLELLIVLKKRSVFISWIWKGFFWRLLDKVLIVLLKSFNVLEFLLLLVFRYYWEFAQFADFSFKHCSSHFKYTMDFFQMTLPFFDHKNV